MPLTLKEAIDHARLIRFYDCKVCGRTLSANDSLVELVSTLRNHGICPQCQRVFNWIETHGGCLPKIDDILQ